jgi:biotin operon repressor
MPRRDDAPRHIGEILREHNIRLATKDPVALGGFTQVPNFILNDPTLSLGAKVAYAKFLQYAWHNDHCFPGQDRLASEIGMSRTRVNEFTKELERAGLIKITRRGQGRTNLYEIKFVVKKRGRGVGDKAG